MMSESKLHRAGTLAAVAIVASTLRAATALANPPPAPGDTSIVSPVTPPADQTGGAYTTPPLLFIPTPSTCFPSSPR